MNTNHSNTNTFGSRSYAQVISQSPATTLQKSRNCSNNSSKHRNTNKNDKRTKCSSQTANATNHSHATTAYKHAKQKIKTDTLKIADWNSNGLQERALETKTFLYNNNIDILLVSETHFTPKSYMKIPHYTIYDTKHPSGKAHGGTAVIIRNDIKHHLHSQVSKEYT